MKNFFCFLRFTPHEVPTHWFWWKATTKQFIKHSQQYNKTRHFYRLRFMLDCLFVTLWYWTSTKQYSTNYSFSIGLNEDMTNLISSSVFKSILFHRSTRTCHSPVRLTSIHSLRRLHTLVQPSPRPPPSLLPISSPYRFLLFSLLIAFLSTRLFLIVVHNSFYFIYFSRRLKVYFTLG